MTLHSLPEGTAATVAKLLGGKMFVERMNSLGLHLGSRVRVIRSGPFCGPLLVEEIKSGARFLLGRQMADQIEVNNDSPGP